MDSWFFPFSVPAGLILFGIAGPEETKNQRGDALRLIQIRLATPSLAKIAPVSQANSAANLIANSSRETR
jgi:hypothetical protein